MKFFPLSLLGQACALACLLPTFFAFSQVSLTPSSDTSTERELGVVTVTGFRPSSLPTQIPTTVEGTTRSQIELTTNATDSEDALKYLPSLLVRKRYAGDYNHAVLSTRASGTGNSARSMVYADGILLSNYLGNGAAFAPRWMMITPQEIERVDVLYGPFSVAYAGNSVGAVVDYQTRMPTQFEAHGKIIVTSQAFSLYNSDASYEGQHISASAGNKSGAWSWFFNVAQSKTESQPLTFPTRLVSAGTAGNAGTPVTGAVLASNRSNQSWYVLGTATEYATTQNHLKAKLAYDLSPSIRVVYTFGLWENQSQGRPQTYLKDAQGNRVYNGTVNIDGRSFALSPTDFNQSNESLKHHMHGLSVKSHTKGVFDWEFAASQYNYAQDQLRAPTVVMPSAATGGAGRLVNLKGTGWNTLALKGSYRPQGIKGAHIIDFGMTQDSYRLRNIENATVDWIAGAAGARNQAFAGNTQLQSLWIQDSWKFAPQWRTVLGLRSEHWSASQGATSNASTTLAHPNRSENHLSPKAALAYQASADWTLKASTGRAVRMPTVSELYQGGISGSGTLINNDPHLKPEKSWTTELTAEKSLQQGFGQGHLRLTAFFENTRDALYSQTNVTVSPNVTNIQNIDAMRTKGLEMAYQANDAFIRGLDLQSSLTWTDSVITQNDKFSASVGKWQPRIPRVRATWLGTYRMSDKLSASLATRYSGKQYSTLDNSDPNGFAYQAASKYFTVDARVRYKINAHLSIAAGVDNLSNYQYWNFHPYPQRSYSLSLNIE